MDRRAQLRELYHLDFPDELFEVWVWYQALDKPARRAVDEVLGIRLRGPFDVLAGKFDDRELRYPAVLHWRYQYDPPELFTVMVGDTDGLHWGYWFDDPGRLPPVVASFYARDAYELTQSGSLFAMLAAWIEKAEESAQENREADPRYAASYVRNLADLEALRATLPKHPIEHARTPTVQTAEHMGIVVAKELVASWRHPDEPVRATIVAFVDAELAAGRPGTALLVGKRVWERDRLFALEILIKAYTALDRPALLAAAIAHRDHPALPSLDLLSYQPGEYNSVADALAHPTEALHLKIHGAIESLDGIGALVNLTELQLGGNKLTSVPVEIARCTKLETINLYNNQLAALPPELFTLPLRSLRLGKNRLVELPGLEQCTTLRELDIGPNPLERLPADLGALTELAHLDISSTSITLEELARIEAALPKTKIIATKIGPSRPYSPKTKYAVDDRVVHPTLGTGVVKKLIDGGKIEIEFASGTKTLVHART